MGFLVYWFTAGPSGFLTYSPLTDKIYFSILGFVHVLDSKALGATMYILLLKSLSETASGPKEDPYVQVWSRVKVKVKFM